MSLRQLLRKPFSSPTSRLISHFLPSKPRLPTLRRLNSTSSADKTRQRIDRLLSRVPKPLRPYTNGLRNAPVSHVVSFLILHEITAIVPLLGLAGLFHYTEWLPKGMVEGKWVTEGIERFGRYFGRKGWFGFERVDAREAGGEVLNEGEGAQEVDENGNGTIEEVERKWHVGQKGGRILVEVATAYAITKVLLPVRILVSVWATPWFARVFWGLYRKGVKRMP